LLLFSLADYLDSIVHYHLVMKIIGHRGARGLAPENTLLGLEKALAHGADALEIDVRIAKDGTAVLVHNRIIEDAEGNTLQVHLHTYEELKAHKPDLPTLTEALELVNQRVPVIIEIKPKEPTHEVIRIVHSFMDRGWGPADLLFVSFDYRILKELHTAFPAHTIIVDEIWSGVRAASRARRLDSRDISIYAPFIWGGFIRAFTRRGYRLYAFPMNDPKKARKWAKLGFYAAITDYPDRFET